MTNTLSNNPPEWVEHQRFDTHQQWVNRASCVLAAHPRYNEGINYSEPSPFKAVCFDSKGRLCRNGGDMARARDEDAFPVYWLWPDQIGAVALGINPSQEQSA